MKSDPLTIHPLPLLLYALVWSYFFGTGSWLTEVKSSMKSLCLDKLVRRKKTSLKWQKDFWWKTWWVWLKWSNSMTKILLIKGPCRNSMLKSSINHNLTSKWLPNHHLLLSIYKCGSSVCISTILCTRKLNL